jgi:clan AA aspartic protease
MIFGAVNAALEAKITLFVCDAAGQPHPIEGAIDTSFSGFLTLPPARVAALGLTWLCHVQGQLADGSLQVFDVYTATLLWDGQPRTTDVQATDSEPLVGTGLLQGAELRIEVKVGGAVTISALP